MNGLFITFEGIDGSGKSLMLQTTAARLRASGYQVVSTREPGGSELGNHIRQILLDSKVGSIDERTETLLYAADRALHVASVIRPALAKGEIVLCDRYIDSSYAYQGSGRAIGLTQVQAVNEFAIGGIMPTLTFFLDLPAEVALSRLRGEKDRLEQEGLAFFQRTAEAFRELAKADPQRIRTIDATLDIETESEMIWQILQPYLPER